MQGSNGFSSPAVTVVDSNVDKDYEAIIAGLAKEGFVEKHSSNKWVGQLGAGELGAKYLAHFGKD